MTGTGETKNAFEIMVGKPSGKRSIGKNEYIGW
jgi:hypothetical protein